MRQGRVVKEEIRKVIRGQINGLAGIFMNLVFTLKWEAIISLSAIN